MNFAPHFVVNVPDRNGEKSIKINMTVFSLNPSKCTLKVIAIFFTRLLFQAIEMKSFGPTTCQSKEDEAANRVVTPIAWDGCKKDFL